MPVGLIFRKLKEFNDEIRMKRFWSCFKSKQGIPGINPQVFLPRYGNEVTFSRFSTFQNLDYSISKILKQILKDLFVITRKDH